MESDLRLSAPVNRAQAPHLMKVVLARQFALAREMSRWGARRGTQCLCGPACPPVLLPSPPTALGQLLHSSQAGGENRWSRLKQAQSMQSSPARAPAWGTVIQPNLSANLQGHESELFHIDKIWSSNSNWKFSYLRLTVRANFVTASFTAEPPIVPGTWQVFSRHLWRSHLFLLKSVT